MVCPQTPKLSQLLLLKKGRDVRFSNRPVRVKRFQTIHRCSVDVAHGLVLLFGIGTKALVWDFCSQEVQAWWRIFFSSSFFADLKVRFFFPGRLRSCDACQATL
ncbi:MAG: hypothetical protein WB505_08790, partial [Pseudolabrys sp.]